MNFKRMIAVLILFSVFFTATPSFAWKFKGDQAWVTRATITELKEKINEYWDKNYIVTNLVHGQDRWLAVFSQVDNTTEQAWYTRENIDDVYAKIKEYWD